MSSITGEPDKNRVKAEHLILSELEDDTDFLVLPEVWTVGWSCEDFPSSAENISDSKTVKLLSDIARKKNVNILSNIIGHTIADFLHIDNIIFILYSIYT